MKQITSLQHPLVKHWVKLRHNRDYRDEHGTVVIDGTKMVSEVCKQLSPIALLVRDETLIPPDIRPKEVVVVSEEILQKITGMSAPEGCAAEIAKPASSSLEGKKWLIALDGVNDPGNIGTLLRTALAFDWEGAFLLHDCCDPFNDKALRAAKGATFHLPLRFGTWEELKALAEKQSLPLFAADLTGSPFKECQPQPLILIFGSEAHGLSQEVKAGCRRVTIPQKKSVDSLNVAISGGILMYHFRNPS